MEKDMEEREEDREGCEESGDIGEEVGESDSKEPVEEEVRRYPLDFESLKKGDVVPVLELERLSGAELGSNPYKLYAMSLGRLIKRYWKMYRHVAVFVRYIQGELKIIDDENHWREARRRQQAAQVKLRETVEADCGADVTKMSPESRKRFERQAYIDLAAWGASEKAIKEGNEVIKSLPTEERQRILGECLHSEGLPKSTPVMRRENVDVNKFKKMQKEKEDPGSGEDEVRLDPGSEAQS